MSTTHWSEQYIGIPFMMHGRSIKAADCWGLARIVLMEQFGIFLPSFDHSGQEFTPETNFKAISQAKLELPVTPTDEPKEGDLVLMKFQGLSAHIGIYCVVDGVPMVLHSDPVGHSTSRLSRLTDGSIVTRLEGFYRVD